jgi:anaerobic magnesium-protoporphyrin IX monomethyl ester cyclase
MTSGISRRNVLMIDIPTYEARLPDLHKTLLRKRLHAQVKLWQERTGTQKIQGAIPYSRGLLTLAACLQAAGFRVKYLIHSDPADRARIPDLLREADFVCINAMTPTVQLAADLCRLAKTLNRSSVTILGGPHIDYRAVETLQAYPTVDFAMLGEAEYRLPALLLAPDKPEVVGGLGYRLVNGEVQVSDARIEPVRAATLPRPAYELLSRPLAQYSHHLKTYRGCPYQCYFCTDRRSWGSPDASEHDLDQVVDELTFLAGQLLPGTLLHFSDSIFNLRWQRTGELLDRIKRSDLNLQFSCDTRVDLIEASQIKALADAGFVYFRMGFESVHDHVLQISKKASTRDKELEASRIIREASQRAAIHAYILTGLPGATRRSLAADVMNIYELVQNDIVDTAGNKILVPYPGTPFGDVPETYGIHIRHQDWSQYDRRSYPVYRLNEASSDEIYFGYLQQEAALTQAYIEKLGGAAFNYRDVESGLGYVYRYYVETLSPT